MVCLSGDFEKDSAIKKVLKVEQGNQAPTELKKAVISQLSHHGACTKTTSKAQLCGRANRLKWLNALEKVYVHAALAVDPMRGMLTCC